MKVKGIYAVNGTEIKTRGCNWRLKTSVTNSLCDAKNGNVINKYLKILHLPLPKKNESLVKMRRK